MPVLLQLIVVCFLIVENLCDLCVDVNELVVRLPIIQVDQHVA